MKINRKNKLLAFGIIVLLLLSYTLAMKKTITLKQKSNQLRYQAKQSNDLPKKLEILKDKNRYYDSIIGTMDINDSSLQNNLIRLINTEAKKHQVKVMDFNQPHQYQTGESNEFTYRFELSGNFSNILKVVYEIEINGVFGEIVHLNFEIKKDYKTSENYLIASILIKQVI